MKLFLASDLHLEIWNQKILDVLKLEFLSDKPDLIILAGDINSNEGIFDSLGDMNTVGIPVVYTPGNHEYWNVKDSDLFHSMLETASAEYDNVHILLNDFCGGWPYKPSGFPTWASALHFDNKPAIVYGGTLWYPKNAKTAARPGFIDLVRFKPDNGVRPTLDWIDEQHQQFIQHYNWCTDMTRGPHTARPVAEIIVSHHMPDFRLIHPQFYGQATNVFFASNTLEQIVYPPKLWCYGHTHTFTDTIIDGTRFLCNPRGYPGEVTGFQHKLFEVEL